MAREPDGYVVEHLRDALAHDHRTGVLDVEVTVAGERVLVTGTVSTAEHLRRVEEVARELCPDLEVRADMAVARPGPRLAPPATALVRLAAVADIHVGADAAGTLSPRLAGLADVADVLLVAGDLTHFGEPEEVEVVAAELASADVPVVAVLGNHDHHAEREDEAVAILERAGICVLEGEATVIEVRGRRVGIAGTIGFGGGFPGATGSDFGEREMKAFVRHTKALAARLEAALRSVEDADARVALLHYAPVEATLHGERLEIYPFLGSYLLAEAIDRAGADIAFHGHAHRGSEKGVTSGGVQVRNVAQPLIGEPYRVYCLGEGEAGGCELLPASG